MKVRSGGATGADQLWAEAFHQKAEVTVVHAQSLKDWAKGPWDVLELKTPEELRIAAPTMERLVQMLNRRVPLNKDYWDVICRNFYQVEGSQAVFAVTWLGPLGYVKGGTAYAVYLAAMRGLPVFVYDMNQSQWFYLDNETYDWKKWEDDWDLPKYETITCIGTRKMTPEGRTAITDMAGRLANGFST